MAVCLCIGTAGPALAQRPGQGQGRYRQRYEEPVPDVSAKSLRQLDPARLARDHGKELSLDAEQMKALEQMSTAFDSAAKAFGRGADSLRKLLQPERARPPQRGGMRPPEKPRTAKDSAKKARDDSIALAKADLIAARRIPARAELQTMLLQIRTTFDSAIAHTLATLTEEQRQTAAPLLDNASRQLSAMLHQANLTQLQAIRRY
jgi:hypothetical protein